MLRQREPRQQEPEYLKWIRRQPCIACAVGGKATYPSEAAHCKLPIAAHGWRGWGLSEKSDDRKCTPICAHHHRTGNDAQHGKRGERGFWLHLGICPACLAEALSAAYDAGLSGLEVIWTAVRAAREHPADHL